MPDPVAQKIDDLLAQIAPNLRQRFLEIISSAKAALDLGALALLLEQNRVSEALALIETVGHAFAAETAKAFVLAGQDAAQFLEASLEIIVAFDQTNDFAFNVMKEAKLDLINEFSRQQTEATREAILSGIRQGLNPIDQARLFRDSIGLTFSQQKAVDNFRRLLTEDPSAALTRELRDGRFDPTLRRGLPLTPAQIDKMVGRYRDNMLAFRAETIARTEALTAVNGGSYEMFRQAIADGSIAEGEMYRTWRTAKDARVRDSHRSMEGQVRDGLEPFTSGDGNHLLFPGDPSSPAADRIQCRCSVTIQLRPEGSFSSSLAGV